MIKEYFVNLMADSHAFQEFIKPYLDWWMPCKADRDNFRKTPIFENIVFKYSLLVLADCYLIRHNNNRIELVPDLEYFDFIDEVRVEANRVKVQDALAKHKTELTTQSSYWLYRYLMHEVIPRSITLELDREDNIISIHYDVNKCGFYDMFEDLYTTYDNFKDKSENEIREGTIDGSGFIAIALGNIKNGYMETTSFKSKDNRDGTATIEIECDRNQLDYWEYTNKVINVNKDAHIKFIDTATELNDFYAETLDADELITEDYNDFLRGMINEICMNIVYHACDDKYVTIQYYRNKDDGKIYPFFKFDEDANNVSNKSVQEF